MRKSELYDTSEHLASLGAALLLDFTALLDSTLLDHLPSALLDEFVAATHDERSEGVADSTIDWLTPSGDDSASDALIHAASTTRDGTSKNHSLALWSDTATSTTAASCTSDDSSATLSSDDDSLSTMQTKAHCDDALALLLSMPPVNLELSLDASTSANFKPTNDSITAAPSNTTTRQPPATKKLLRIRSAATKTTPSAPAAAVQRVTKPRKLHHAPPATSQPPPALPAASSSMLLQTLPVMTGRKRVKDEIESLQQLVAALEARLQKLSRGQQPAAQRSHPAHSTSASTTNDQLAVATTNMAALRLWKRAATRQRDACRVAEAENTRLRSLLTAQLKFAATLERSIQRHARVEALDVTTNDAPDAPWLTRQLELDATGTESLYTQLEASLDDLLALTDVVLRDALAGLDADVDAVDPNNPDDVVERARGRMRYDAATGRPFLEIVGTTTVPFDIAAATTGYWTLIKTKNSSASGCGHGYEPTAPTPSDDNALRTKFYSLLSVQDGYGDSSISSWGHMVGRRHMETTRQRAVLIWCSTSECAGRVFGSDRLAGREVGWTVLEQLSPASGTTTSSTLTRVTTVCHMYKQGVVTNGEPRCYHEPAPVHYVRTFAATVQSWIEQNADLMSEGAESVMLRAAAAGATA